MHQISFEMLSIRSYSLKDTRTVINDILKDDFDVEDMKIEYHVDNLQYLWYHLTHTYIV